MSKLKPEDIQYRIPGVANRFVSVYRKPIFYIIIVGIFAVVTALAVAYNMSYFHKANKSIVYINCNFSYEGKHIKNYANLTYYLSRVKKNSDGGDYLDEYDVYFTRYDTSVFATTDAAYNTVWDYSRHFGGTVLESAYSGTIDDVPYAIYIVDETRSAVLMQITYEELGIERGADLALERLPELFEEWVTA